MKRAKKELRKVNDTQAKLGDWFPFFGWSYQYTLNLKIYLAVMWMIGVIVMMFAAFFFLTLGLPRLSWQEATVISREPTESLCLDSAAKGDEPTYKFGYVVNSKFILSDKAFCDTGEVVAEMLYNPSKPSDSIPANNSIGIQLSLVLVAIGAVFITFGYMSAFIIHMYMRWLNK